MSEIKNVKSGSKYAHASVGVLGQFEGKSFLKETLGSTSCEISYGSLGTGEAIPFFHSHKENEEHYLILSGEGRFQVDDEVFDISEGSVIRVSTNCDRNLKCTSSTPMIYVCVQAKEGSLGNYTATDGVINERENLL